MQSALAVIFTVMTIAVLIAIVSAARGERVYVRVLPLVTVVSAVCLFTMIVLAVILSNNPAP